MSTTGKAHNSPQEKKRPYLRDLLFLVVSRGKDGFTINQNIPCFTEACDYLNGLLDEKVEKLDDYASWLGQVAADKETASRTDGDDSSTCKCLDFALSIIQLCNIYVSRKDAMAIVSDVCEYKEVLYGTTDAAVLNKVITDCVQSAIKEVLNDKTEPSLRQALNGVVKRYGNIQASVNAIAADADVSETVKKAGEYLDKQLEEKKDANGQDRSSWELRIEKDAQRKKDDEDIRKYEVAEAIVDICYLYTCEFSISGLKDPPYKPIYDSVLEGNWDDQKGSFYGRVVEEAKRYLDSGHIFLHVDKGNIAQKMDSLPDWDRASRIVTRVDKRLNSKHTTRILTLIVVGLMTAIISWNTMNGISWKLGLGVTIAAVTACAGSCLIDWSIFDTLKLLGCYIWDFMKSIQSNMLTIFVLLCIAIGLPIVSIPLYNFVYSSKCRTFCSYFLIVLVIIVSSFQYNHYLETRQPKWLSILKIVSTRAALASFYYIIMLFVIDELGGPIQTFVDNEIVDPLSTILGGPPSYNWGAPIPALLAFLFMNIVDLESLLHVPDFDDAYGQLRSSVEDYYSVKRDIKTSKTSGETSTNQSGRL